MRKFLKHEVNNGLNSKVIRTAAQTAVFMMILTLVSKLFGFIREMVLAAYLGTSYITDAYVMAIAIPGILLGGIFTAIDIAYIPLFSKITETESEQNSNRFTNEVINLLLFISIIACIIGFLFSDQIVGILASGFDEQTAVLTSFYVKITFTYLIFISITGILEAFLRYKGVFLGPVIIGYFQNALVIIAIIISAYFKNYNLLVFGWLSAYILRGFIIWIMAKHKKFNYMLSLKLSATSKMIFALSFPVFIGSGINQINAFVDKFVASALKVGSVAALNYGYLLMSLIISLTVSILMTIIYPRMAQAQALQNYDHFNEMVSKGFNLVYIVTVPCTMGIIVYSEKIVQIVYERGAFDLAATDLTKTAFFYYSLGLVFLSLNALFVQTYYSMHDMKTPVIYGAIGVIINVVLNLVLVRYMAHSGIALATSIASFCNTGLLYYGFRKKYNSIIIIESKQKLIKILIAAIISIGGSAGAYYGFIPLVGPLVYSRTIHLGITVAFAGLVYFVALKIFKVEEIDLLKGIVKINKKV